MARDEVLAARDALIAGAIATGRDLMAADDGVEDLLGSVFLHFVNEFMSVFQAAAVARRLGPSGGGAGGGGIVVPAGSPALAAIARGAAPDPGPARRWFAAGPARPSRWRAPLRLARNLVVRDGILRQPPARADLVDDIVATTVGALVERHARAVDRRVVYRGLHAWFRPSRDPAPPPGAAAGRLIDAIVARCREAFAAAGEGLSEALAGHFRAWLTGALAHTEAHLARLRSAPERLPRRLWVGSGADAWTRMLCYAARRAGGHVTGHDHATGYGHLVSEAKTLAEFWACDAFVTFNAVQARALAETMRPDLMLRDSRPEIVPLPARPAGEGRAGASGPDRGSRPRPLPAGPAPAVRTILYVPTLYPGEKAFLNPVFPDYVAVDWQARLIARLRAWGFDVLVKVHPENRIPTPRAFSAGLGARLVTERFERVMHLGDVLLFDYPLSTTFGHALAGDRPMVFVDFGFAALSAEGRALLERRCATVEGWYDARNRAQTDWDRLRAALAAAGDRLDPAFADTFLAYG